MIKEGSLGPSPVSRTDAKNGVCTARIINTYAQMNGQILPKQSARARTNVAGIMVRGLKEKKKKKPVEHLTD